MKIKKPKRIMSLFLAALMCVTSLVGIGTTAYAAEETDDVYLISYPRDGDSNYNAEWGHSNLSLMNGWKTGTSRYTTVRAMGSYNGNICYCIEIGVPQQTGDSFTKKGEDFWDNYPSSYNSTISPDDMSMQTVVQEINTEYDTKLQDEKTSVSYDVLEMSGSRAVWKEVLAVYSVKVNTDPDNPQEVATMDESKKQLLTDIFWEMNEISSSTDTKTETVITETDDGHGNIVETESTVTQTYLYITVSHKTADEMAAQYSFNEEQKEYLAELLADENNSLWSQVLYGITGTDDQIVTVALSQIGTMGGDPYWSWYGFNSRVEWCACFVSWCANECGYIDAGVIPKYAGCVNGVQWFKDRGQWLDNSAEPTPGMIIFFDWADESGQDGLSDHTGIVQKVENGRVYTVEGNSGDSVRQNSYPVGYYEILGYGAPAY